MIRRHVMRLVVASSVGIVTLGCRDNPVERAVVARSLMDEVLERETHSFDLEARSVATAEAFSQFLPLLDRTHRDRTIVIAESHRNSSGVIKHLRSIYPDTQFELAVDLVGETEVEPYASVNVVLVGYREVDGGVRLLYLATVNQVGPNFVEALIEVHLPDQGEAQVIESKVYTIT